MIFFRTRVNVFIRVFIVSDAFLFSSLNLVNLFFALFVTQKIGGSIQAAAYALALGYVVRVATELTTSRSIGRLSQPGKLRLVIAGMAVISAGYLGFAGATNISMLYFCWGLVGLGWGLAFPTKLSLVSAHIDKKQATQEWSLTDAFNISLIAATTAAGGYIAGTYGLRLLFMSAFVINTLGIVPYLLYLYAGRPFGSPKANRRRRPRRSG